jgi:hypothetical protein
MKLKEVNSFYSYGLCYDCGRQTNHRFFHKGGLPPIVRGVYKKKCTICGKETPWGKGLIGSGNQSDTGH